MKSVIFLLMMVLSGSIYADGVCTAKEFIYKSFCETRPNKATCNLYDQCEWANAGYGACSSTEFGYEAFCGAQPNEMACNFHDECFWVGSNSSFW